jgi:hypothetical protein
VQPRLNTTHHHHVAQILAFDLIYPARSSLSNRLAHYSSTGISCIIPVHNFRHRAPSLSSLGSQTWIRQQPPLRPSWSDTSNHSQTCAKRRHCLQATDNLRVFIYAADLGCQETGDVLSDRHQRHTGVGLSVRRASSLYPPTWLHARSAWQAL